MSGFSSEYDDLAARLRYRVTLQRPVDTPDGGGGQTRAWEDVAELWAEISPQDATSNVRAEQFGSRISHRILLRYRGGVLAGMRIAMGMRVFTIRGVTDPGERRIALLMFCEEEA